MTDWPPFGELPVGFRARLVRLAAEVLADLPGLSGPLRQVAGFVPARRARLGAPALEQALATDSFRSSVAVQVRARRPGLATTLDQWCDMPSGATEGGAPAESAVEALGGDRDLAALVWLTRPEHGAAAFVAAVRQEPQDAPAGSGGEAAEVTALRTRVDELEQTLRDLRSQQRQRLEEARQENATLRRRVGEARTQLRAAQEEAEEVRQAARRLADSAEHDLASARSQVRRLRAQVSDLEARVGADTRDRRSERDQSTVRARLLLDALGEAAHGLRRELALPPVEGLPADTVDAVHATDASRTSSRAGVLGPASPELLEHLLAMPRARLLVDGYNVSRSAWPSSPLEAQRIRLAGLVGALVARTGAETTVVFDAQHAAEPPPTQVPRGVKVVFSPYGVIADDVIVEYVEAEPAGRVVVVVTDDVELAERARRGGARVLRAGALLGMLGH